LKKLMRPLLKRPLSELPERPLPKRSQHEHEALWHL